MIQSVPLEDDGGAESEGSHLERFLFGNELMTPENPGITIISVFSLAVLKDFGVYRVDLGQAEEFYWGRNTGCQFFFNFCQRRISGFGNLEVEDQVLLESPEFSNLINSNALGDKSGVTDNLKSHLVQSSFHPKFLFSDLHRVTSHNPFLHKGNQK